jgi:hypothetical protein
MNRKIKSDLFRFVTLRTPQVLTEEQKVKNFVFHPNLSQSAIYNGLQPQPTIPGGVEPELPVDGPTGPVTFTPIKTKAELKALSPGLFVFSQWLGKNRSGKFAVSEVVDQSRETAVLNEGNLLLVWENVFYQTMHKKNAAIREALIQLLVANHFVTLLAETAFSESLYEDFTITANAKLVIPKLIAARRQKSPSAQSRYVDTSKVQSDFDTAQKLAQMERYQSTITELQDVNRQYNAQTAEAYKAALDAHEVLVNTKLETATKVTDPETGRITYPDVVFPKFTFTPVNPLAQAYLEDRVSNTAHGVFDALALGRCNNLAEAIATVENEMQKLGSSFNSIAAPVQKVVVYRGNAIETNITQNRPVDVTNMLYGFIVNSQTMQAGGLPQLWNFSLRINTGYTDAVVTAASYTASYNNDTSPVNQQFTQVSNNGYIVNLALYSAPELAITGSTDAVRLQGTLTLDNGNRLAFDVTVTGNNTAPGIATLAATGGGEGENGGLIGIHQMGIADYRKVEQEVCCYIPGEVSHIENVMKGEYKERATRRLRRSENTLETSAERETENLSDTTSTERNEMHNEVSRVINKDQSINANASLNGNFSKISFSASAGYASNTSQSDSASQAVNYAKDVTTRAMERVVQKITEKRTTKMIDEFEETTKHGLDNRGEGAQNVSGVYHWIDKVYTNQVINYGKRLMYELMVPEPARFLTKVATAAGGSMQVLNKPVDPSTLLKDAKEITTANYQHFAAMYNAEVKPAPVSGMSIGKSFSSAFTTKGSSAVGAMAKSEAVNVKIPEGYFTKAAKVQMSGMADGDYNWGKGISVGVGNSVLNQRDMMHPYAYNNFNAPLTLDRFVDEIPVSVFFCSFFTGQVTVAIELEVLTEFVAKWQNETYGAIIAAYEAKKEAYEKALADALDKTAAAATQANSTKYNPLQSRMIEMAELKKNCLQLMLEPYGNPVGVKTIRPDGAVNINGTFATHADKVRFFEAAFEWEIMSYIFYPYFWADEAEWKNMFSQEDGDPLFKAFLQSGMGKVILSVRPGFEEAVMYYLETGEIWDGKNLAMDDELYLSILAEQLPAEGKPEGEPWETRLPTSLTTLQGDSIALTSTGLPCACDDGTGNGFSSSNAGLIGKP